MQYVIFRHISAFCGSLLFGWYIVPKVILAARKLQVLDVPDGKIKQHEIPVPYLGGVAVYIVFIMVLAFVYPFENRLLWLILGTTFLLFVGLVDDLNVLSPRHKLLGQIVSVLCFLKGGFSLKTSFFSDWINIAASGFWMLSVINAFNLVDVMDGLATVLAFVAGASFFVISLLLQAYDISLLLIAFLGVLVAFFLYNRPPARIYLGDAGALFIGGFLAAVPLLFPWISIMRLYNVFPSFIPKDSLFEVGFAAVVPILIVGLPLLEVASLIVIRKSKGLPFYMGSPHHFCLYLKNKNWSVSRILFFSGINASVLSWLAIAFMFGVLPFWLLVLVLGFFSVEWLYFVFL